MRKNPDIKKALLYEDNDILVCFKEPGLPVQSARLGALSLEDALKTHLREEMPDQVPYLGIVQRLDQPVCGILVFAKTPSAAAALNNQITSGAAQKLYLAMVRPKAGTMPRGGCRQRLTDYMIRDGKTNTSRIATKETVGAKKAVLDYEPFFFPGKVIPSPYPLLQIHLLTGRHHQIRVQLAHDGMPLLGDRKYNPAPESERYPYPALCAWSLSFKHPVSHKEMHFSLEKDRIWFLTF